MILAYYLNLNILIIPAAILFVSLMVIQISMRKKRMKNTMASYLFFGSLIIIIFLPPSIDPIRHLFFIILGTIYFGQSFYETFHRRSSPRKDQPL